ncbi:MAG: hypothetical protein AAF804_00890 [Bacteroidota bacterium]
MDLGGDCLAEQHPHQLAIDVVFEVDGAFPVDASSDVASVPAIPAGIAPRCHALSLVPSPRVAWLVIRERLSDE